MTREFSSDQKLRIITLKLRIEEGTAKLDEMQKELQCIADEFFDFNARKSAENENGVFSNETLISWRAAKTKFTDFRHRFAEHQKTMKNGVDELFSLIMDE